MNDMTEIYKANFHFFSAGKSFSISGTTTIGRSKAELVIDDKALSSIHCQLTIKGTRLFITDLGSTNGTFLNGKKIEKDEEKEIQIGEKVRIGSFEYTVKDNIDRAVEEEPEVQSRFQPKLILSFFKVGLLWKVLYFSISGFYLAFAALSLRSNYKNLPPELSFFNVLSNKNTNHLLVYLAGFLFLTFLFHAYISQYYLKVSKVLKAVAFIGILVFQTAITLLGMISTNSEFEKYIKSRNLVIKSKTTTQPEIILEFEKDYEVLKHSLPVVYKNKLDDDYKETISKAAVK